MCIVTKRKVAVVGSGVAGLSTAWHLYVNSPDVDVHLYESEDRLGGHAHTFPVNIGSGQTVDVDIGFMVFNDHNYPNMTEWFKELGVKTETTDMSLSVSLDNGKTAEWSSLGINGLLANKTQIFKPAFHRFLRDMIRFNKEAGKILTLTNDDPRRYITIGQYLKREGYSVDFATHYLLPMVAAIWSASMGDVMQYPAVELISFLCNHRMMQIFDRFQWNTVTGRSQQYTLKIQSILGKNAHVSCPITKVNKINNEDGFRYELFTNNDHSLGIYEHVVFACHPPTASKILKNGSGEEFSSDLIHTLDQIRYEDNVVYVHSDANLMPRSKNAWASWNCLGKSELLKSSFSKNKHDQGSFEGGESGFGNKIDNKDPSTSETMSNALKDEVLEGEDGRMKGVYITYYLNRLQNLNVDTDIFVSLNPHKKPDSKLVYKRQVMSHPQYTPKTVAARKKLNDDFQGRDGLWFCGAWQGYGFHEDGCRAGFEVATSISKIPVPWCHEEAMVLPPPDLAKPLAKQMSGGLIKRLMRFIQYSVPVYVCKRMVLKFLSDGIKKGSLVIKMSDGNIVKIGDGTPCGCDSDPVTLKVFDDWFFVKIASEYDLGLARSYMAGFFTVEKLSDSKLYDSIIRPPLLRDESNAILGDPIGLTRLFHLIIQNRDASVTPRKSAKSNSYSNAFYNAAGLFVAKFGSFLNFVKFRLTMDNSERGGSLKNIHAHYDLSNDLFRSFLDRETLMYSSAIYDAIQIPSPLSQSKLAFRGSLEEAEWRKLDTLLSRAQVQPGETLLDIGFGWGGLTIHAAKKYGCKVTGITLSVEQKALAEERIQKEGLGHLVTFEVVDYRVFARRKENTQKFHRVISCEMIEAVGHNHLGDFFWAVEQVLAPNGVLVMEAITTPESRYENYRRTTDFINTIIFPGSCCPSLHALVDASYQSSTLTLEHIDNIGIHYAETLREWRRRFNANEELVRNLGFDDVFLRVWNYYLTYCEAAFDTQTENCLILVFSRPGCRSLMPLCEMRSVTQAERMSPQEVEEWFIEK